MSFVTFAAVAVASVVVAYKFVPTFHSWADSVYVSACEKVEAATAWLDRLTARLKARTA